MVETGMVSGEYRIQSVICPSHMGHFREPIIDFLRQCLQNDFPHFSHSQSFAFAPHLSHIPFSDM